MKDSWRAVVAILALGFVFAQGSSRLCYAQQQSAAVQDTTEGMSLRVQELEKEVGELRSQLASLKQNRDAESAPAPAAAPPANAASTTQPATKSLSGPSIASLLGPTSLSGFVDMYYDYNSNQPASRTNSFRSFDGASNQFALNLVELVVDKTPEITNSRTGYHIALGFGQAMNAINSTDPGGLGFDQYLKEAYFSYLAPVGKGLQIDAGKFVTPNGAEVIETKDDLNYSRGLLFSYAIPYYHYGLRAKYAFSDKYSISGCLGNGWNNVLDNNTGKTYGIGFGWNPNKKISFTQNFMAGPEQSSNNSSWRQLWDTVITYSPTTKLSFTLNTDYGRGDHMKQVVEPVFWTGAAGYVKYAFNEKYAVVTRYEYYDDANGFTTGTAQHFNGFTATFQRLTAGHILSRLEFRRDMSNEPTFVKGNGLPAGAQNTLTAGLVFMFDTHEAR